MSGDIVSADRLARRDCSRSAARSPARSGPSPTSGAMPLQPLHASVLRTMPPTSTGWPVSRASTAASSASAIGSRRASGSRWPPPPPLKPAAGAAEHRPAIAPSSQVHGEIAGSDRLALAHHLRQHVSVGECGTDDVVDRTDRGMAADHPSRATIAARIPGPTNGMKFSGDRAPPTTRAPNPAHRRARYPDSGRRRSRDSACGRIRRCGCARDRGCRPHSPARRAPARPSATAPRSVAAGRRRTPSRVRSRAADPAAARTARMRRTGRARRRRAR